MKRFFEFLGLILFLGLLLTIGGAIDNRLDHRNFETIKTGEITVLEVGDSPIFVPKGAMVLGDFRQFINGDVSDALAEGIVKKETLVTTTSKAVVYWSLDQKIVAEKLLQ